MTVASWVGRRVRITDGPAEGETGIVLAVDDTPHRPSAWVKVRAEREFPGYRSCDLCWLEDEATGESGPAVGTASEIEDQS